MNCPWTAVCSLKMGVWLTEKHCKQTCLLPSRDPICRQVEVDYDQWLNLVIETHKFREEVSDCCFMNARWTSFRPHNGNNKLLFDEIKILRMPALFWTNNELDFCIASWLKTETMSHRYTCLSTRNHHPDSNSNSLWDN